MSKGPFLGQIVNCHISTGGMPQGEMTPPLAAIVVCVLSDNLVHLAGWDRYGQPFARKHVSFGKPNPQFNYCTPASDEAAAGTGSPG